MKLKSIFIVLFLGTLWSASAQDDMFDIELEELLDIKVSVASGSRSLSLAESPGIVSVLTREQLLKSGVKDLSGALKKIPGIGLAVSPYGVIGGVFIRGLAGFDGKVLVLLDGIELNERAYGTVFLGNRIPIELIEKIEVIRGPGSALYGGFAELGVVNIITRKRGDFEKSELYLKSGVTNKGNFNGLDTSVLFGGEELDYSAFLRLSHYHPGDGTYTDSQGVSYDREKDNQNIATAYANLYFDKLSWNMFYDEIRYESQVGYAFTFNEPYEARWRTLATQLRYTEDLSEKLKFTPTLSYKYEYAWATKRQDSLGYSGPYINSSRDHYPYKLHMNNLYTDFKFDYEIKDIAYTFGWKPEVDYVKISESNDYQRGDSFDTDLVFKDGDKDNHMVNNAFYGQMIWLNDLVNVTLGARYEYNSEFGGSFAPRFALTKDFDGYYMKFLASKAFRPPTLNNIFYNELPRNEQDYGKVDEIDVETSTNFEFELGMDITENSQFIITLFDMAIDDPITFYYNGSSRFNSYINAGDVRTRGVELQYSYQAENWYSKLFYSYYEAQDSSEFVDTEMDEDKFLGVPQHTAGWEGGYSFSDNVHWSLSAEYRDKLIGYGELNLMTGKPYEEEIDPAFFLNTWIRFDEICNEDVSLGFGIDNIFDEKNELSRPADGFIRPVPYLGRTFRIQLEYRF